MNKYPESIKNLISIISRFPGLGPKTAERIVFYLHKQDNQFTDKFIQNINKLKREIKECRQCFNIATQNPCDICTDPKRDKTALCVVAEVQDILVIEKTGEYQGLYHVLGGVLNPVQGITPEKIKINELIKRVKHSQPKIKEVIIATNPDLEGESTAMYLSRQLKPLNIKITRLAKGLPMGSTIEYADEVTMSNALKGRREV